MTKRAAVIVVPMILALAYVSHVLASTPVRTVLHFSTMYAVDGPFVGDVNPIRGLEGDGLPWAIRSVEGSLFSDGFVTVSIRGLVFTRDPEVPPELRGINDEEHFRAVVSCLTEDGDKTGVANVQTGGFAASRRGDSFIAARVKLPNPCVAPIVFITGDEGEWLAVTGVEN
jgi:hypothetical protein